MRLLFLQNQPFGNIIQAFCWMLVHSLWQGLVFTILTGLAMVLTKKSSAQARYNLVAVLFFLFIAVCGFTFLLSIGGNGPQSPMQNATASTGSVNGIQAAIKTFCGYFSANASLIVMVWFVVFCAKCVRMAGSIVYSQRVKHHKTQQPPLYWANRVKALAESLSIKRTVQLLESEIVKIPVVIGHLKPIVFIPIGLLNSLPAGEVEAVLLHELAHIRRSDYFVNFIQVIAENIFFFNPALLWISSLLREERENCCDDVALAQTKSKKQFIQALISFKQHALHTTKFTTAFPAKKNQLLQRVSRIVHNKNKTLNGAEKVFFLASFAVLAILCVGFSNGQGEPVAQQAVHKISARNTGIATGQTTVKMQAAATFGSINEAGISSDDAPAADGAKISLNMSPVMLKANGAVIELQQKTITDEEKEAATSADDEAVTKNIHEPLTDAQQAELDRQEAAKDQAQAEEDRKQAEEDRKQAEEDRKQALRDQAQADLDRKQAEMDRLQAMKDQQEMLRMQQEETKNKLAVIHQPKKH